MNVKWRRVPLLVLLMGGCFSAGVWASDGIRKVEAFLRPDFRVVVDGKQVNLENSVLVYNDSSYMPLRQLGELLNADVKWQDAGKTIYVNKRFEGQPETPAEEDYTEVRLQNPIAYEVGYLGGTYTLLAHMTKQMTYYRVDDLSRMGIDTRGLMKSKDYYTGALYVTQDEVGPLWKDNPRITIPSSTVIAGSYDPSLKDTLVNIGKMSIPYLGQNNIQNFPKVNRVLLGDAISGRPGWFCFYARSVKNELVLYMVKMEQNDEGEWYQRSIQTVTPDYYLKFFENAE